MNLSTPRLISEDRIKRARVTVVGDVMLDRYWHGSVDRISPEAPVPVVKVEREVDRAGGAANVAYNVCTLGATANLVGTIGFDVAGDKLDSIVRGSGVNSFLLKHEHAETTVKIRVVGRAQQLLRLDREGPVHDDHLIALDSHFEDLLSASDVVLFSDYGKGALANVGKLIGASKSAGKKTLVDPKGVDYTRYAGATALTPNKSELQQVVGGWSTEDELRAKARQLRERLGLEALIVTRSEEGMSLFDAEGELHVNATAKEVFDVTGAGDTVIAVLATLLGSGLTLRQALPIANAAGGLVVGRLGTAALSFEELLASTS